MSPDPAADATLWSRQATSMSGPECPWALTGVWSLKAGREAGSRGPSAGSARGILDAACERPGEAAAEGPS